MNVDVARFPAVTSQVGATKQLLADEVFRRIGASIIDGTLPPGYRIRDAELAEQFNMSRMPIREALQRLERIGLVEMFPSRYTRVTEVTPELTAKTLEFAGYFAGWIMAVTVPKLSDEERHTAVRLAEELDGALYDGPGISAARWALIHHLTECCENEIFHLALDESSMMLFRNLRSWTLSSAEADRMRALHAELAAAIAAADARAAERVIRAMHFID